MLHLLSVSGAVLEEFFEDNAPQLGAAKGAEWSRYGKGIPPVESRFPPQPETHFGVF